MSSTAIEQPVPRELALADIKPRGRVFPSPDTWRDQVLYFLMPDRFSDGNEAERPLFDYTNPGQFKIQDKGSWMEAGKKFQGGTLRGIMSKLDYLQRLGATALWLAPVWRQRAEMETYHGYGIQNFLEVDPRFGTRQDLRDLIDAAHDRGMYVLLDVIYNHMGDNFFYKLNGAPEDTAPYRFQPPYPIHGWRSGVGTSTPTISTPEDGVWPKDFQKFDWYTRAGQIGRWDPESWEDPLHPDNEFRRGDFFSLKDLNLDRRQEALSGVIHVYKYWIALSDCDGFRIDTVKHVSWETSRNFCGAIHEYTESIGKENFLLLGEVTGGAQMARDYLDIFGRNIDAVLDIGDPSRRLAEMVKGNLNPIDYFDQFKIGHDVLGSHRQTGRYHISVLDDHDMVGRGKHRFAALSDSRNPSHQVAHAVDVQLTTLGIPCIYYGTEQAFDGTENRHDRFIEPFSFNDRYIRESMFGGTFGAYETANCHFFNSEHPTYLRIEAVAKIRSQQTPVGLALRRGRQYLRQISPNGGYFSFPGRKQITGWSRIMNDQEVLAVLNTDGNADRGAAVTVHGPWHPDGSEMKFLYRSDWSDSELKNPPADRTATVSYRDGRATVWIDLPPAGMAILA